MDKEKQKWTLEDWQRNNASLVKNPIQKPVAKVEEKKEEKLNVEFTVEKSIEKTFGYVEKLLKYDGRIIHNKAIVKNGQFVNIVGRQYKLIPNEEVLEKVQALATARNLTLHKTTYDWRMYLALMDNENNVGVLVSNSVDGTIALRADAIVKFSESACTIMVATKIHNIYRRHTENLTSKNLDDEITNIYDNAKTYKKALEGLDKYKLSDYKAALKEMLEAELPDIYTKGLFPNYNIVGRTETVKSLYEDICKRIWSKDNDLKTKMTLYKKLNDAIASIGVLEAL